MLLNLVNDILDLSQMEVQKMEVVPVPYHNQELIEELVDMIQIQIKEKKLDLFVAVNPALPTVLLGDEKRIKQVLLNILSNAVKYTEKGSVTFSVQGEKTEDGKIRLNISVADTGIGIKKEDLESLYDVFRRVDKKKNAKIEGSGLGLYITKQLLDLMGGEITVDSIYTKGSTFSITLEQEIVDSTPVGRSHFEKKTSMNLYQYEPGFVAPEGRILIVDDNSVNAAVEKQLLKDTKLQVDIAKNGSECLQKTKQKYYHVILMDYFMAEMSGADVVKEVRKQENGLCRESCVLLMTAASSMEAKRITEDNDFDGYLEKPIIGNQLEKELMKFLPPEIMEQSSGTKALEVKTVYERKKKKIYITTDCISDLPEEYLEKYNIKIIYTYIKTERGRFADTSEINSDNLLTYISDSEKTAFADSTSVEEYEQFFAEMLTQAQHVIHISMAKDAGKSYESAVTAAKGFDHVQVIDSGYISGAQSLVVLYAAKLVKEGCHRNQICEEIEKIKGRISIYCMLPSIQIFYQNGYANSLTARFCSLFRAHPVVSFQQSKAVVKGIFVGSMEKSWKNFIRHHLSHKNKISPDIIFVSYVGCSVKQLELIKEEILKYIPFEQVIMQKACFSNACNSGPLTIGLSYFKLK